jgi:hypothetical protein
LVSIGVEHSQSTIVFFYRVCFSGAENLVDRIIQVIDAHRIPISIEFASENYFDKRRLSGERIVYRHRQHLV